MNRTPARSTLEATRASLRQDPAYAGVPDEVLDQIATLVLSSTSRKILASLRSVQLFEALGDEDVARIQELGEIVELAPGEVLFEEGRKGDSFYIVLRGRVELVKRARDGSEQKLAVAREGEAFGEMALLNQSPRSATARALEASSLLELSRPAFDAMLGPESFATRMLRGVAKALWATSVRFASTRSGADARDVLRSLSQVLQKSVLPASLPPLPGYSAMGATGAHERAAGESAWDCFLLGDGRWAFTSLRAHSEGLPAGSTLVLARTLLRELGKDHPDPARLLVRVNQALVDARVPGAAQRVECGLAVLDERELVWAAAGPVGAAWVRADGSVAELPAEGPALGVDRGAIYRTTAVPLMVGDALVSLVRAGAGALARAAAVLGGAPQADARELVRRVSGELPADDPITGEVFENTLLLIKRSEQAFAETDARPAGGNPALRGLGEGPALNA